MVRRGRGRGDGRRYVRTPEGSDKYGLPIGALITADAIERAKRRGRNYSVPEDGDRSFGSTPPAAGQTRRSPQEIVKAIRNSPAPRQSKLNGPETVAVGDRAFSVPSGSRVFHPKDSEHSNFAYLRTPDYQLHVLTDSGISFELDGDLEKELNDHFDGDGSGDYDSEQMGEPDPQDAAGLEDVDGDGEVASVTGNRPARVEDSPGYLSEDMIQNILSGIPEEGFQRDLMELQLRRNNDRIRNAWQKSQDEGVSENIEDDETEAAPAERTRSTPPEPDAPAPTPEEQAEWDAQRDEETSGYMPGELDIDFMDRLDDLAPGRVIQDRDGTPWTKQRNGQFTNPQYGSAWPEDLSVTDGSMEWPDEEAGESLFHESDPGERNDVVVDRADEEGEARRQAGVREVLDGLPDQPRRTPPTSEPIPEERRARVARPGDEPDPAVSARRGSGAGDESGGQATAEDGTEGRLSELEELARSRPSGVAEGEINGAQVTVRRNRTNDKMEYSVEGDSNEVMSSQRTYLDRDEFLSSLPSSPDAVPQRGQVIRVKSSGYRGVVIGPDENQDGNILAHFGGSGVISVSSDKLEVVRSSDDDGEADSLLNAYDAAHSGRAVDRYARRQQAMRNIQEFLDDDSLDDANVTGGQDEDPDADLEEMSDSDLAKVRRGDNGEDMERRAAARRVESRRAREKREAAQEQEEQPAPQRDTSGVAASDLTDQELEDLSADLEDILDVDPDNEGAAQRSDELFAERERRTAASIGGTPVSTDQENEESSADESTEELADAEEQEEAPESASGLSTKVRGAKADPLRPDHLGVVGGKGDFADRADQDAILDARPGDKFLTDWPVDGSTIKQLWEVREDGKVYNLAQPDGQGYDLQQFSDLSETVPTFSFDGNKSNKADGPSRKPGDAASRRWSKESAPGSAAFDSDGVLQTKRSAATWTSPLGESDGSDFDASDVANDTAVIARTAPSTDGKPVGATRRIGKNTDPDSIAVSDGVLIDYDGQPVILERRSNGTYRGTLPSGVHLEDRTWDDIQGVVTAGKAVWHIPNGALRGRPSKRSWKSGDPIQSLDDVLAQKPGTTLRYKFLKPRAGKTESTYTVLEDGILQHESGTFIPASAIDDAIVKGQLSVIDVPEEALTEEELPQRPAPVASPSAYKSGDQISDYRHLQAMKPGQQVTLLVPASQNGGNAVPVVLTRTHDNSDTGGFMFIVGRRGRGYNSFGENNTAMVQAVFDGRVYFGDITKAEDADAPVFIEGDWSKTRDIDIDGVKGQFSENDLRTFINSQVASPAMQVGYFDPDLLPNDSPFRNKAVRDEFYRAAVAKYSEDGNPARPKPAAIRLAAEALGYEYTDPGATIIPDDLDLADFSTKIRVGRFKSGRGGVATSWEPAKQGEDEIEVAVSDVKTALAAIDNMLKSPNPVDPDKILKRVFARQGSALQHMNPTGAMANYFGMRRVNMASGKHMQNHPAVQNDKRRNLELMRQMLLEQLEGRAPGYYGVPDDEVYTDKRGNTWRNYSTISRPSVNSDNDPERNTPPVRQPAPARERTAVSPPTPEPEAPEAPATEERIYSSAPSVGDSLTGPEGLDTVPDGHYVSRDLEDGRTLTYQRQGDRLVNDTGNTIPFWRVPADSQFVYRGESADGQPDPFSGMSDDELRNEAVNNPDPAQRQAALDAIMQRLSARLDGPQGGGGQQSFFGEDEAGSRTPQVRLGSESIDVSPVETFDRYSDLPAIFGNYFDRKMPDTYELDESDLDTFNRAWTFHGGTEVDDLNGRRIFLADDGSAAAYVEGDTIYMRGENGRGVYSVAAAATSGGGRYMDAPDTPEMRKALHRAGYPGAYVYTDSDGNDRLFGGIDAEGIGVPGDGPDPQRVPDQQQAKTFAWAEFNARQANDFHVALDRGRSGDGRYVDANGQSHGMWGKYGAAGVLVRHVDSQGVERFLLAQREGKNKTSPIYHKWQLPGGGLDEKETDAEGAGRELIEELNSPAGFLAGLTQHGTGNRVDHPSGWHYTNIAATTAERFDPKVDGHELADAQWFTRSELAQMSLNGDLHPELEKSIRGTLAQIDGNPESSQLPGAPTPNVSDVDPFARPARPGTLSDQEAAQISDAIEVEPEAPDLEHGSFNEPGARPIPGTAAGSNGGQMYDIPMEDGSTQRYFVKPARSDNQGKQEALASALYKAAGVAAPDVDYRPADKRVYSKEMELSDSIPSDGQVKAREGFAADAWLANWDIRMGDNVVFDRDGNAVRLDNGGSLEYRAQGQKKGTGGTTGFGNTVGELDTLRQPGNLGHAIFGSRRGSTPDAWEVSSAQRVVDIPDETIRELVSDHNLPDSLANTLIARRDYIANHYGLTPTPRRVEPEASAPVQQEAAPETPAPAAPTAPTAPGPARPARQGSYTQSGEALDSTTVQQAQFPGQQIAPAGGELYDITDSDGATRPYSVSQPRTPEQGKSAATASQFYQALGIGTVEADYDANEDRIYTKAVGLGTLNGATEDRDAFVRGVIADAWLGNRGVGQSNRYGFQADGTPIRVDNRGALTTRLNGQSKPDFGSTVSELDSLRTSPNHDYGPRSGNGPDDWEYDEAQKLVDTMDDARIRQIVSDGGMDSSVSDTLIARRDYIADYYGLAPSWSPAPDPADFRETDDAETLVAARRATKNKLGYLRAFDSSGFSRRVRTSGSVGSAFDELWRERNPDKPDRGDTDTPDNVAISNPFGKPGYDPNADIDALLQFDTSSNSLTEARRVFGANGGPADLHLYAIWQQRGFLEAPQTTSLSQFEADFKPDTTTKKQRLFRSVQGSRSKSAKAMLDGLSGEEWFPGAGVHGAGVYATTDLGTSRSYGQRTIDFGIDLNGVEIGVDTQISQRASAIMAALNARTDLTPAQRHEIDNYFNLSRASGYGNGNVGRLAAALGYQVVYGNAGMTSNHQDYVVHDRSLLTFHDGGHINAASVQGGRIVSVSRANASGQGSTVSIPAGTQLSPAAAVTASGLQPGYSYAVGRYGQAAQQQGMRIQITYRGVTYILRYDTYRGWINTATNRRISWMGNFTPGATTQFQVV